MAVIRKIGLHPAANSPRFLLLLFRVPFDVLFPKHASRHPISLWHSSTTDQRLKCLLCLFNPPSFQAGALQHRWTWRWTTITTVNTECVYDHRKYRRRLARCQYAAAGQCVWAECHATGECIRTNFNVGWIWSEYGGIRIEFWGIWAKYSN